MASKKKATGSSSSARKAPAKTGKTRTLELKIKNLNPSLGHIHGSSAGEAKGHIHSAAAGKVKGHIHSAATGKAKGHIHSAATTKGKRHIHSAS